MKRKWLAIGIILVFVGTNIIPSTAQIMEKTESTARGNWLYVGGSGPGNYSKIQDAINDSHNGDTVFVYDDSSPYYEHLVIEKSIALIGENRQTTILDGENSGIADVVSLDGDGIVLRGFTIQNSGNDGYHLYSGVCLQYGSSLNTISDTCVTNNYYGLIISHSSSNSIENNSISNNRMYGLYLSASRGNTIVNNTFTSGDGLSIFGNYVEDLNTHTILNNTMDGRLIRYYKNESNLIIPEDTGVVILANCTNCIIRNLDFSDTDEAIQLLNSSYTIISENTIQGCAIHGIRLLYAYNNDVRNNMFRNNTKVGLYIFESGITTIGGNTFIENTYGIYLSATYRNRIIGNTFLRNQYGIGLVECNHYGANGNVITNNTFVDLGLGVYVMDLCAGCHDNYVYHNTFINCSAKDQCDNTWDARYPWGGNYWSTNEGTDENNDGIGDTAFLLEDGINADHYPLMNPWEQENQHPKKPQIHGCRIGKINKEYTYQVNASDSNGDAIWYLIDWGDQQTETIGPFHQNKKMNVTHTWSSQGKYLMKVKSIDPYDTQSTLVSYRIWIPFSADSPIYKLFEKLAEQYPHAFPFLRYLLGLS
ncbi:MAG TPA: NosD domain-containing protein [Candidatus Thermoplasmatota archaeon]|nr:NosD domain-containing protein [Candidatus Thermoplasmatota archaeon]